MPLVHYSMFLFLSLYTGDKNIRSKDKSKNASGSLRSRTRFVFLLPYLSRSLHCREKGHSLTASWPVSRQDLPDSLS